MGWRDTVFFDRVTVGTDRPPRYMPGLDGVRALLMCGVFAAHLAEYGGLGQSTLDRATEKVALRGGFGVTGFFVLSGFLITGGLLDTRGRPGYFRSFYAKRSLRIFPLYFAFVALVMLVVPALFEVDGFYREQVDQQWWYWTYLTNVGVAINGWLPFQYFGHFWTLAVEEQFYLVWPLVVLAVPRARLGRLCLVLMVAGFAFRVVLLYAGHEVAADVLLPANVDALALGAWLALRARSGLGFQVRWLAAGAVGSSLLFASMPLWPAVWPASEHVEWALNPTAAAVAFGCIMMLVIHAEPATELHRLTTWRPLVGMGIISYGIYVFHQPVIFAVVRWWHLDATDFPAIGGSHLPGLLVVTAVTVALSLACAWASYRLLERPLLRLKSRFDVPAVPHALAARESVSTGP